MIHPSKNKIKTLFTDITSILLVEIKQTITQLNQILQSPNKRIEPEISKFFGPSSSCIKRVFVKPALRADKKNHRTNPKLAGQIGLGKGDELTPDLTRSIIIRDPFCRSMRKGRQPIQRKFTANQRLNHETEDGFRNIGANGIFCARLRDRCAVRMIDLSVRRVSVGTSVARRIADQKYFQHGTKKGLSKVL